jgi:hypothetical protein
MGDVQIERQERDGDREYAVAESFEAACFLFFRSRDASFHD